MIDIIASGLIIISLLMIISLLSWYVYLKYKHDQWINKVFFKDDTALLSQNESKKKAEFKLKLVRAGLSQRQFTEIVAASIGAGLALSALIFILDLEGMKAIGLSIISISIASLTPFIYLEEQIKARIKRIENDLAIFIDLLIIILEGGGGLNNAIDKVTVEGTSVIKKDLLDESRRFKNEMITYSSDVAYRNLVKRTGSEAIGTIVGFMKLSEETGIGVKTIFENQSEEIKAAEILDIEKRAATMNISMTFTMFIFILPAVIAMIVFPMAADALMPGF